MILAARKYHSKGGPQGRDSRENMTGGGGGPKVQGYHFWKLCMALGRHVFEPVYIFRV